MSAPPKKKWLPFKPTALGRSKNKDKGKGKEKVEEVSAVVAERQQQQEEVAPPTPAKTRRRSRKSAARGDGGGGEDELGSQGRSTDGHHIASSFDALDEAANQMPPSGQGAAAVVEDLEDQGQNEDQNEDQDQDEEEYGNIFKRRREVGQPYLHSFSFSQDVKIPDASDGEDQGKSSRARRRGTPHREPVKGKGKAKEKGKTKEKNKEKEKGKEKETTETNDGNGDGDEEEWTPTKTRRRKRRRAVVDQEDEDDQARTAAQGIDETGLISPSSPPQPPAKTRKTTRSTRSSTVRPATRQLAATAAPAADPFNEVTPPQSLSPSAVANAAPLSVPSSPSSSTPIDPELQKYVKRALITNVARSAQEQRAMDCKTLVCITTRLPPNDLSLTAAPETAPMAAMIKLGNKIKILRDVWFTKYSPKLDALRGYTEKDVVLTWRGQRLWEFNTLYSLGIRPRYDEDEDLGMGGGGGSQSGNGDGSERVEWPQLKFIRDGGADGGGGGTEGGGGGGVPMSQMERPSSNPKLGFIKEYTQVHIEAWTSSLWKAWQEQQQQQQQFDAAADNNNDNIPASSPSSSQPTTTATTEATTKDTRKVSIKLLTKSMPPLELRIPPTTTMETLAAMFRKHRGGGGGGGDDGDGGMGVVAFVFDGERMAEHATLEEAGIDDDDAIQVHVG